MNIKQSFFKPGQTLREASRDLLPLSSDPRKVLKIFLPFIFPSPMCDQIYGRLNVLALFDRLYFMWRFRGRWMCDAVPEEFMDNIVRDMGRNERLVILHQ